MSTASAVGAFRPAPPRRTVALVAVLTAGVAACEASLFYGVEQYTVPAYLVFLVALSLAPLLVESETALFQAFALVPVFRVVNLTMPVFFDLTLLWFPLVYGPLLLVFVYIGRQALRERRRSAGDSRTDPAAGRQPTPREVEFDAATPAVRPLPAASSPDGADAGGAADDGPTPADVDIAGARPAVTPVAGSESPDVPGPGVAVQDDGGVGAGLPRWLGGEAGGTLRWLFRNAWNAPPRRGARSPARALGYGLARVGLVALAGVGVVVALLAMFLVSVGLAELEYGIVGPSPLVPSLGAYQIGVLTVVMIGFVGLVEELLFRGVLQQVLERRLGTVPGLLVASGVFGLMHSVYGLPAEIAFAAGVGLLFGVIYDLTDSLLLVAAMHGTINVFLFGIIPLDGGSSIDLLQALVLGWVSRLEVAAVFESVAELAVCLV